MGFAAQLRILEAAKDSPALLALATVDFAHHALAEAERSRIKQALVAAAVPHWCDRDFLAVLLETTPQESGLLLTELRKLTVLEPFPARGKDTFNVHEAARLALREHLRVSDAVAWKTLSARARAHVVRNREPHARIEALFHLFATDQPAAAEQCEALERDFASGGSPEVRHALALCLQELTAAGWLTGAAKVEALYSPLEVRNDRGEAAQLEAEARGLVELARNASYLPGIARAQCLLGDVLEAKGRLDDALAAYREFLAISRDLVATDPSNPGRQREVAVAHSKLGDIHQVQGRLDDALAAYREFLAIAQRLAAPDPSNAGPQRDLAVAHSKIGDIHQEQGRLDDALAAYSTDLAISQRLSATDPSSAGWQRDLAVAYSRVGDIHQAQGRRDDALAAYREDLAIFQRLAASDPSSAGWQREVAVAHSKVGGIHQEQGRLDDALAAYREYCATFQRLAATDPSNAGWQRDLAVAQNRLGRVFREMGLERQARSSLRAAVKTMARAAKMSPENPGWKSDLDNLKSWLD
ncbi:MAG TPA: tetratricopeptide repeat protein [Vineibacter sp.]|nr:tetratricopeptide repeat protein [Vineibacter sp.]